MEQCIAMQLSHVSLKIKQKNRFYSQSANHHFNYAHFVVFVLELSSIILLTFVHVRSSHSFPFPFSMDFCRFSFIFVHFPIFESIQFSVASHQSLLEHQTLVSHLWQMIVAANKMHSMFLGMKILWKMHWYKVPTN